MNMKIATAAALSAGFLLATTEAAAGSLDIGLDMSGSNELVKNETFAAAVAARVEAKIRQMSLGDRVRLRFFGSYGANDNLKTLDVRISRRNRAPKVAKAIGRFIRAVPSLIENGRMSAQGATNIIAYLEERDFACEAEPTDILLITDGFEVSVYTNSANVVSGRAKLPAPGGRFLEGCALTMLGVGRIAGTSSPIATRNVSKAWSDWADAAGASRFTSISRF